MDSAKRNWEILLLCVLVKLNKNNYSSFTEDIFVIKKRNGYIKTSQKTVLQKFQLKSNFSATLKLAFFYEGFYAGTNIRESTSQTRT